METKTLVSIAAVAFLLGACADADRAPKSADRSAAPSRAAPSKAAPSKAAKPDAADGPARNPVVIESLDKLAPASGNPSPRREAKPAPKADRAPTGDRDGDDTDGDVLNAGEAEDEHFLSVLGSRPVRARKPLARARKPSRRVDLKPSRRLAPRVAPRTTSPVRKLAPARYPAEARSPAEKSSRQESPEQKSPKQKSPARKLTVDAKSKVEHYDLNAVSPGAGPVAGKRMPDAFSADRGLATSLKRRKTAARKPKTPARKSRTSKPKASFNGTLDEGKPADADVLKMLGGN